MRPLVHPTRKLVIAVPTTFLFSRWLTPFRQLSSFPLPPLFCRLGQATGAEHAGLLVIALKHATLGLCSPVVFEQCDIFD